MRGTKAKRLRQHALVLATSGRVHLRRILSPGMAKTSDTRYLYQALKKRRHLIYLGQRPMEQPR